MYMCWDCCQEFYQPDEIEIRTPYENYRENYTVDPDFPNYTVRILDVCPFCKSDNIEEVNDIWDPEVS